MDLITILQHQLRGESGIYYKDLYPLICHLPRYANTKAPQQVENDILPLFRELHGSGKMPYVHVSDAGRGREPQHTTSLPEPKDDHDIMDDDKSTNASWYQTLSRRSPRKQGLDTFDPEKVLPTVASEQPLKPGRNPPETSIYDYIPLFRFLKWLTLIIFRRTASLTRMTDGHQKMGRDALGRKRKMGSIESNVPMEICLYLSR